MDLKSYVFSVITASVVAGILLCVFKANGAHGYLIKLLAGLYIAITVVSPWRDFHISDISYYFDGLETDSSNYVNSGLNAYNEALQTSITERTEAYILEKASSMGAELTATVTVSNDQPLVPISVELSGNISPYNKSRLQQIIVNDLGIPEAAQKWR